jgi:uncharacterized membrane protein
MRLLAHSLAVFSVVLASTSCAGEREADARAEIPSFRIVTLIDRDGPSNSGTTINDHSLIGGYTETRDGRSVNAALWSFGFRSDLEGLGGPNSMIAWRSKNRIGLIAGIAQTGTPEPLDQTWSCRGFFPAPTRSGFICSAVVWETGQVRALPTLGGHNGFATAANGLRQIVGWAQNTVLDSSCDTRHVKQQFRAVIWGPGENQIRELPPLAGDTTSAATAIDDKGRVVGISGDCGTAVGGTSARAAVMWKDGKIRVLGNLGGVAWNTPMALNQRGDVVGFSNVSREAGATPNWRAFQWTEEGGIEDLGALEDYPLSQAFGINDKRQIVGRSCKADFSACRAVMWIHGDVFDLNDLAPGYASVLYSANDISNAGDIAGQAFTPGTDRYTAIHAVPRHGGAAQSGRKRRASDVALPESIRKALLQQYGLNEKTHRSRL